MSLLTEQRHRDKAQVVQAVAEVRKVLAQRERDKCRARRALIQVVLRKVGEDASCETD